MECKFLNDGRKVVVVGQLNNVESIVQEIFVTESGDEVPSGERFTTKSLHDEPVLSFKAKQAKAEELHLERVRKEYDEANRKKKEIYAELKGYQTILKSVKQFTENVQEEELEVFTQFLTGTIEYLVMDTYSFEPPVRLIDSLIYYETRYGGERTFDGVRLLNVLGASNGDLSYRISRYSDGSGSSVIVHPFTNKEDALNHIRKRAIERIENGKLSEESWQACIDMGIEFDDNITKKFNNTMSEIVRKRLKNTSESLKKQQELVKQHEEDLKKYEKD